MLTGIRACGFDAYDTLFDLASAAAGCAGVLVGKAGPLTALWRDWDRPGLVDPLALSPEVPSMARTRRPYSPEFRRRMVEPARAGRDAHDLGRAFEPTAQSIRNWIARPGKKQGRQAAAQPA